MAKLNWDRAAPRKPIERELTEAEITGITANRPRVVRPPKLEQRSEADRLIDEFMRAGGKNQPSAKILVRLFVGIPRRWAAAHRQDGRHKVIRLERMRSRDGPAAAAVLQDNPVLVKIAVDNLEQRHLAGHAEPLVHRAGELDLVGGWRLMAGEVSHRA
jgi:hypothetical protein